MGNAFNPWRGFICQLWDARNIIISGLVFLKKYGVIWITHIIV